MNALKVEGRVLEEEAFQTNLDSQAQSMNGLAPEALSLIGLCISTVYWPCSQGRLALSDITRELLVVVWSLAGTGYLGSRGVGKRYHRSLCGRLGRGRFVSSPLGRLFVVRALEQGPGRFVSDGSVGSPLRGDEYVLFEAPPWHCLFLANNGRHTLFSGCWASRSICELGSGSAPVPEALQRWWFSISVVAPSLLPSGCLMFACSPSALLGEGTLTNICRGR